MSKLALLSKHAPLWISVLLLLPASGWAQQAPGGGYGGVTLNGGEPPSPKAPPPGMQYVTWPGFKVTDSGTEVFLQLTGQVTYKVKRRGRRLMVTLDNTLVYLKNNLRPVITTGFPKTPVKQFRLRRLKKNRLRLEITLRRRSKPTIGFKTTKPYTYLVLTFPHRGK